MYWQEPADDTRIVIGGWSRVVIGLLVAAILLFGVVPGPILASLRGTPGVTAEAAQVAARP